MKMSLSLSLFIIAFISIAFAEENQTAIIEGKELNIEITTGLQGSLSFAQIGLNLPQFIDHFLIGIKLRGMSSLTWATFINEQTKESVSFHPVVIACILSFGGTGDVIHDFFRSYGSVEILTGYSFTPYDSLIYNVGNLLGNNITLGIFGVYGLEFFTSERLSVYIESGGGFKTMKSEYENQYIVASSWLGSGVTFRMGAKIYF